MNLYDASIRPNVDTQNKDEEEEEVNNSVEVERLGDYKTDAQSV